MWRIRNKGRFTSHTKGVSQKADLLTNSANIHGFLYQGLRAQLS